MSVRRLDSIPDVEEVFLSSMQMKALEILQQEIANAMWEHKDVRSGAVVHKTDLADNDPVLLAVVSICRRKGWEVDVLDDGEGLTVLKFWAPWQVKGE